MATTRYRRAVRPWTNPSPRFRPGSCVFTCERCGRERMVNEAHSSTGRSMLIRDIIAKMRHDGCGGMAEKVELLSGIEGVSSRPVRRIVLREG